MTSKSTTLPEQKPLIHVSDGLSQKGRVLPALQENYFNVEELSFEQLLALARDYARVVNYYRLDNRADGVWDAIFSANELVVIATILSIDLRKLEAGFELRLFEGHDDMSQMFEGYRARPSRLGLPDTASPLALAQMLDYWMLLLSAAQSNAGEELRGLIESVVIGLRKELQTLAQIGGELSQENTLSSLFSSHFVNMGFKGVEPSGVLLASEAANPIMRRAALRSVFSSFVKAVDIVQAGARRLLPASMISEHHDPAVALLVAFVKLYQKLQSKINRFTQDHLDFYYQQVLMAQPQALVPDTVHLVMQVTTPNTDVVIPKDTEFLAGLDDDKRDIIYAADHDVVLNDAAVTRLHTLFFPSDHGVFARPESQTLTKACWQDELTAMPDSESKDRDKMQARALLGAPRDGKRPASVTQARLGFALADNVLLMREGKRKITVSLQYDQQRSPTGDSLESQIKKLTACREDADAESVLAAQKDTFFKLFSEMFSIGLTTSTGWLAIEGYLPCCSLVDEDVKENSLVISFTLPADTGAIVAYSPEVHGENYNTALPLLRFTLNPNEYQYPYDILKNLALKEARIDVKVQGCRELLLHNNIGQLSPLAPFAPFGPIPTVGSYFVVGYAEVRTKQLSQFDVDVEWGDLPPTGTDFSSWYRGYSHPPLAQDFVAGVSVLANGKWLPSDSRTISSIPLFMNSHEFGRAGVARHKRLSCDQVVPFYKPQDNHHAETEFAYTPSSKTGLFKFTLAGPVDAFGHQEYPHLLSHTLTYNSKVKSPLLLKPIPKPPYTPQITSISLNYAAFSVISMESSNERQAELYKDKLLHLHPMGWESMSRPSGSRVLQLPQYDAPGTLIIGLTASAMSSSLTLYFHLHRDSLPMSQDESPGLEWSYLSNNQWRKLDPRQIVADSTEEFMTSGIVTLNLPDELTRDNTIMPSGLFWLKISAYRGLKNFCQLYSVYAQAVQASWRRGDHASSRNTISLRAGTITKPRKTIAGLGKVTQVCRSFNGKLGENSAHLRTRVSERLRHKNRALTPRDYETLILDQFPEIYKVKCFANLRSQYPGQICPGHVLIVPVPYLALDGHQHQKPRLSGHMIHAVREFVQKLAPPFATISVENPLYEEIQVRCTITLKPGLRGGYYSNLLNQALCEHISPWNALGYTTHFGWCIRQFDLESYIQSLDYIEHVSDFSLLRVAPNGDQIFTLDDSARRLPDGTRNKDITPKYPWSVAVPITHHYIQITDRSTLIEPCITGVEELEVGSTFIISAKD